MLTMVQLGILALVIIAGVIGFVCLADFLMERWYQGYWTCRKCGLNVTNGFRFCPNCVRVIK